MRLTFVTSSIIVLCTAIPLLIAGTIVLDFHGQTGFNKVTIKWTSQNEVNLKGFEIERSFDEKSSNFKMLKFLPAKQEQKDKKQYEYEDTTVFKSTERTFYYRLKIIDMDGSSSHSKIISVSPTVSSARQTWGSIKAMFR
ncbi:MAG: hypothetical protein E2O78_08910 [Caldithrix sp.]|nr:MAG: hypothetical protein E2O78_08910 [Caldithrix sp.]